MAAILFHLDACDRTIADEGVEIVGCPGAAAEVVGVSIAAELAALRSSRGGLHLRAILMKTVRAGFTKS